ncbi:MAG: hypothetical protein C4576_35375 [Desulfobacteraceae bacterium]|nr:MAG: hypothetical protein C4576_35375 [Desulfobacteraceae bacterium]
MWKVIIGFLLAEILIIVAYAALPSGAGILSSTGFSSLHKAETPDSARPEIGSGVRKVQFSGMTWKVKASTTSVGPGPNFFSDRDENVWVDARGRLHLRITYRDGIWWCAEVIGEKSLGYGSYRFHLATDVDTLDPSVVLGLFTWSDDPSHHNREIDIEMARWGDPGNEVGQYVVQPYTEVENMVRFHVPPAISSSLHSFSWRPESISFRSESQRGLIQEHTFSRNIPPAGGENPRINLWLFRGWPPEKGQEVEVTIESFEFSSPS